MKKIAAITLLYTANLAGDLGLLPRLFSLIQRERRTAAGPVFLLDLGDSCALEAWICRATQGRAPLIVLDGMGYDVALVGGPERVPIPLISLQQLSGRIMMGVVPWNRVYDLARQGVTFRVVAGHGPVPPGPPVVWVDRSHDSLPSVGDDVVTLGDVEQGGLARVDIAWPDWRVQETSILTLRASVPADPTISALVEFVQDEARHYMQQQGGTP